MRVLITRGEADARPYADICTALGATPVHCPLYTIDYLHPPLPDMAACDALIFTSAHGIRAFAALTDRRDRSVYVVGPQSETVARAAGFTDVLSAGGSAEDLARLIPPGRYFYGRGADIAHPLRERLAEKGGEVMESVLYRIEPVSCLPKFTPVDVALFFSTRAAQIFAQLVEKQELKENLARTKALCLGAGMLEFLKPLPWRALAVAPQPDRTGMTALIQTELAGNK